MMTLQTRAFGVSLLVHALFLACILAALSAAPRQRTIRLDLSIGSSPMPAAVRREIIAARPPVPRSEEQQMVTPVQEDPEAVPVQAEHTSKDLPPVDRFPEITEAGATSGLSGSPEGYIDTHFSRIRDRILKLLTYPALARTRGWSGTVLVSFTVVENGLVEDLRIEESSGHALLDRNAMETVRKACPLPRPPARVALIMPIVYRLR